MFISFNSREIFAELALRVTISVNLTSLLFNSANVPKREKEIACNIEDFPEEITKVFLDRWEYYSLYASPAFRDKALALVPIDRRKQHFIKLEKYRFDEHPFADCENYDHWNPKQ